MSMYLNLLLNGELELFVHLKLEIQAQSLDLSPHDASKHHFKSLKTHLICLQLWGFRTKISMKLVYQYMAIFFIFSLTSSHLHLPQPENCSSNSRVVVDEDDNDEFRLERVK